MTKTSQRGLGSPNISEEKKHDIQSQGGKSSPQNFANNPDLAQKAGRKGGQVSSGNFKNDPQRASSAGKKGRKSRSENQEEGGLLDSLTNIFED